jgi:hypothetical protein
MMVKGVVWHAGDGGGDTWTVGKCLSGLKKNGHINTLHIARRIKLTPSAYRKMVAGRSVVMREAIITSVSTTVEGIRSARRSLAVDMLRYLSHKYGAANSLFRERYNHI